MWIILIGTRQQLGKINDVCNISVGDYDIYPSCCVRNLGPWFDSKLSMSTHLTKICNAFRLFSPGIPSNNGEFRHVT